MSPDDELMINPAQPSKTMTLDVIMLDKVNAQCMPASVNLKVVVFNNKEY
ncbi:hypothetical protein JMUB7507_26430 [Staphylococcus aureus]